MKNPNHSFQYEMIMRESALLDELQNRAHNGKLRQATETGIPAQAIEERIATGRAPLSPNEAMPSGAAPVPTGAAPSGGMGMATEAIIVAYGRPSLIIQDGTFAVPESSQWRQVLLTNQRAIETAIASVGRIELINHFTYDWVGTGWLVAPDIVVTNRHVAEIFCDRENGGFSFARNIVNQTIGARLDLREEYDRPQSAEIAVEKIIYVAPSGARHPDIAILKVKSDAALPDPLPLSAKHLKRDDIVGVIGYPAYDSRNGADEMKRYFGDIFDVKRFAPGRVQQNDDEFHYFLSDYTSLGGNSGSAVIDLESGEVVGLHFAGRFMEANFAVKTSQIKDALTGVAVAAPVVAEAENEAAVVDRTYPPEHYEGRDGYQENFLGDAAHAVPMPELNAWSNDIAPVTGAPDGQPGLARYRHFSVIVAKSRKLPLVTAVNINGQELRRVPRVRDWYGDGRLSLDDQAGNEVYRHNDLDRGHMVRRLDPVWGDYETAKEANDDTFHYTNAAPQHKHLNQKDWVELESLILDHAGAKDLKMSVMTGPVLRSNDPTYRDIQLPREFWKVVILVNAETDQLAALGFVLTHSHLVRNLEETMLRPGTLQVYQVPLHEIEAMTGLGFPVLRPVDTIRGPGLEADVESMQPKRRLIRGFEDITV